MTTKKMLTRILATIISLALLALPLAAQKRKDTQPAPKEAARAPQDTTTFENLLAADDYKIFGEIKNVGQLIRSPNVAEILDPVMVLAGPPKEFKSLVKFANAHAEFLTTARLFFASWPAQPKIPQTLLAIEFSSPDEAQKFEPQLREFLPTIMPSPTPSPAPGEAASQDLPALATRDGDAKMSAADSRKLPPVDPKSNPSTANSSTSAPSDAKRPVETKPAPLPFAIKRMGSLVLISDTPVNLKALRPANSELLFDSANFRQAHDRFGSEQIFVFVNLALDEAKRIVPTDQQSGKAQAVVVDEAVAKAAAESATPPAPEETGSLPAAIPQAAPEEPPVPMDPEIASPDEQAILMAGSQAPEAGTGPGPDLDFSMNMMMGSIFGGTPKWPDAVGVAIAFEGDSYAARVLLVGGPDGKASPVPFIGQWVSGPALTLQSPTILPADTELFVAASLDAPQIYEGLVKTISDQAASYQRTSGQPSSETQPAAPFAFLEKKLGLKFKEDLFPVLGHEIAVSVPVNTFTGTTTVAEAPPAGDEKDKAAAKKPARGPVILISVKDKEAARMLVPRIVEGLGFKGAGMLAQKETRDDTEIVSYAGVFSYAFVANFLVVSPDAATTRHVVDSYLAHQTLASDSQFRNSTRWQPRQLLGQVYVSPVLMESYRTYANNPTALVSETVREFLTRLSPVAEPVTYSLSSDGLGPLHELHVPRNLILMAVAGIADESNQSPLVRNEQMTRVALMMIANSEKNYHQNQGKGQYASLEQLFDQQSLSKELFRDHGYRFELTISGDKFTATAVPNEYNKTGRLSYFVDETGIIRGADHGGAPATVNDSAVQ